MGHQPATSAPADSQQPVHTSVAYPATRYLPSQWPRPSNPSPPAPTGPPRSATSATRLPTTSPRADARGPGSPTGAPRTKPQSPPYSARHQQSRSRPSRGIARSPPTDTWRRSATACGTRQTSSHGGTSSGRPPRLPSPRLRPAWRTTRRRSAPWRPAWRPRSPATPDAGTNILRDQQPSQQEDRRHRPHPHTHTHHLPPPQPATRRPPPPSAVQGQLQRQEGVRPLQQRVGHRLLLLVPQNQPLQPGVRPMGERRHPDANAVLMVRQPPP